MLGDLVRLTGVPIHLLEATLLSNYVGVVVEGIDAAAWRPWILPLGIYHRTRRRAGTQWCPECLSSDGDPYYRTRWRLAFVTACLHHHCILHDRCEGCQAPAAPHRVSTPVCHLCGTDRRLGSRRAADARVLALQSRFEAMIERGEPRDALEASHPLAYLGSIPGEGEMTP